VDERFTRYISNLASCGLGAPPACEFGQYSGADAQLSYVYDRDLYRFTANAANDPCRAVLDPAYGRAAEPDPVKGLDDNDELAFMYRDAGPAAPPDASKPAGIAEVQRVRIDDPAAPGTTAR